MTALDQAFIRAYTQQDVVSPSTSSEPVRSVPLDDALLDPVSKESTDGHGDVTAGEMAEALAEALASPPANLGAEEPLARQADQAEEEPVVPEVPGTDSLIALLSTAPADGPFLERRVDAAQDVTSLDAPDEFADGQPVMAEAVLESYRIGEFLPSLRVEYFLWPEKCLRMSRQAPDQLSLLTDSLSRQAARGRKVVGLGGHAAGEGCTTILLSAARSLAGSSMKTIIVDADFGNPCLGERLGIACRIGWDDVLASSEPLEEAAIESERDRLTLLPLRQRSSKENDGSDRRGDLGTVLRRLREHYDLVLVDLGELDADTLAGDGLGWPIKECIDAVVVVHDVRKSMQSELDEVRRLLQQAELVELGVIESFV
jgi:Mrp family chromosome partitioning ATPase